MKAKLSQDKRYQNKSYPIIALTGGIASGKSTLAKAASELGYPVISADELIKDIYSQAETVEWLQTNYPNCVKEGKINFSKLREQFFSHPEDKLIIENYLYQKLPHAFSKRESNFKKIDFLIYEIPLLFEKNLLSYFDLSVLCWTKRSIQIERLKKRNPDLSDRDIESFLNAQIPIDEKKNKVDYVFDNSAPRSEAELIDKMKLFWKKIIEG